MEFYDDPRRAQIEPMHEFMQTWARWGKIRPSRYTSSTYQVMCWVRDHSKRVENIRESIVTGQPIHYSDPDNNRIALKVEHYLCQMMQEGYPRDAFILKTYYLSRDSANLGYIAKLLDCKPYQVEGIVKGSLYRLSCFWND